MIKERIKESCNKAKGKTNSKAKPINRLQSNKKGKEGTRSRSNRGGCIAKNLHKSKECKREQFGKKSNQTMSKTIVKNEESK